MRKKGKERERETERNFDTGDLIRGFAGLVVSYHIFANTRVFSTCLSAAPIKFSLLIRMRSRLQNKGERKNLRYSCDLDKSNGLFKFLSYRQYSFFFNLSFRSYQVFASFLEEEQVTERRGERETSIQVTLIRIIACLIVFLSHRRQYIRSFV